MHKYSNKARVCTAMRAYLLTNTFNMKITQKQTGALASSIHNALEKKVIKDRESFIANHTLAQRSYQLLRKEVLAKKKKVEEGTATLYDKLTLFAKNYGSTIADYVKDETLKSSNSEIIDLFVKHKVLEEYPHMLIPMPDSEYAIRQQITLATINAKDINEVLSNFGLTAKDL